MHASDKEELDLRFSPPAIDGGPQELGESVEPLLKEIATMLLDNIPDCRELSLALTKLEESYHWMLAATRNMPIGFIPTVEERHPMSERDREAIGQVAAFIDTHWSIHRDAGELETAAGFHAMSGILKDVRRRM